MTQIWCSTARPKHVEPWPQARELLRASSVAFLQALWMRDVWAASTSALYCSALIAHSRAAKSCRACSSPWLLLAYTPHRRIQSVYTTSCFTLIGVAPQALQPPQRLRSGRRRRCQCSLTRRLSAFSICQYHRSALRTSTPAELEYPGLIATASHVRGTAHRIQHIHRLPLRAYVPVTGSTHHFC